MKRLIALLVMLLMAGTTQAQTATPTTSPIVHLQLEYQFETDPNITYSGVWTTVTSGQTQYRQTSSATAYAAFTISGDICSIAINGYSNAASGYNVLVGASNFVFTSTFPDTGFFAVIDTTFLTGDAVVKINQLSAGTLFLDSFRLLQCQTGSTSLTAVPTPTAFIPVPTATILPSSTPFIPVPTATAINTSTPFIPVDTATAVPTVPTATAINTSTPANTPVDTATAVPTATPIDVDLLLTLIGSGGSTLTPSHTPTITNTPTETHTPTPEPWAYITLTSGQLTRFDYVATTSDVHNANIITLTIYSIWAMFLFYVFVQWKAKKK